MNWTEATWFWIIIWMLNQQSVGFQPVKQAPPPPHHHLFEGSPKNDFSKSNSADASLQMERPLAMPHQDFTALTKEDKRNLPDHRDGFIIEEGRPHLAVRYYQVNYKTPDHGDIHGLPVNTNGKTPKTEENVLALRDSIVNMPDRKGILWFENGQYQGGNERGYDSVNLYAPKTRVIAVFKKQGDEKLSLFTTTCKLTGLEAEHLLESGGNFVTDAVLKQQNNSHGKKGD